MNKKNKISSFLTNPIFKSLIFIIIISFILIAGVLFWLNIYTKHNESISVPSIKRLQVEDAAGILKSHYLDYKVVDSLYLKDGVPGSIIEQIPQEESKVKKGRTIFLIIQAKGQQLVSIPYLKDYSQRQAEAQLQARGFSRITIQEVPSQYKGLVISIEYNGQPLVPGQKIPKGAPLRMKVGSGIPETEEEDNQTMPEGDTPQLENSFFE